MPYRIRHRSKAQELERCREDYPEFATDVDAWVMGLAGAAERRDEAISLDVATILAIIVDTVASSDANSWRQSASGSMRRWPRRSRPCSPRSKSVAPLAIQSEQGYACVSKL